jgi:Outer membrane protein beta-barrel domain
MRKAGFLSLAIIVFIVSGIHAQGLHLGLKAGVNLAQVTGRSFNGGYQTGFSGGGFAELKIDSKWDLQPELLYAQTQATTSDEFPNASDPQFHGIPNRTITLNYINIPVLISYKLLPVLSIQAGPSFGFLMSTSENIMTDNQNAFKTTDFSVVGGAQVNLSKIKLGARYSYGLTDISKVTPTDTWKNQNIQVYIGFLLF